MRALPALALALLVVSASEALPRGVDPALGALYAGPSFTCRDGSKTIPIERVNDGYCDCFLDGSDEPGTPACYSGHFWCQNLGFEPQILSTSFLEDGVCDCCDGSDEAPGKCKNTCLDRSASEREAAHARVDFIRQALDKKQAMLSSAVERQRAWQHRKGLITNEVSAQMGEVSKLQAQVKQAAATVEEERKKLAEETEKKQAAEAAEFEAQAAKRAAEDQQQQQQQQQEQQQQQQQQEQQQLKQQQDQQASQEADTMETDEERGRRIESQWIKPPADAADSEEDTYEGEGLEGDYEGGMDSDAYGYDDDEDYPHEDEDFEPGPAVPEPPSAAGLSALETQLQAAQEKLEALQKEVQDIQRYYIGGAGYDFGPNNLFLNLAGRCLKEQGRRWVFEACFFDKAVQTEPHAPKNRVGLGSWAGFNKDYTQAIFAEGDPCPGDLPKRSFTVTFVCDDKEELFGGEESPTCVYRAKLATPVACKEEELHKAQQQLAEHENYERAIRAEIDKQERARADASKTEL